MEGARKRETERERGKKGEKIQRGLEGVPTVSSVVSNFGFRYRVLHQLEVGGIPSAC